MNVRTIGSSRPKNAVAAPCLAKNLLGQLDLVLADQDVLPVALQEGPATVRPDRVGNERAKRVPDGRGDHDEPVVPRLAGDRLDRRGVRDEEAREGEDQLGRQRDHRRLDGHREEDPEVPD